MAFIVSLSPFILPATIDIVSVTLSLQKTTSLTDISGFVIVPVLSTHSTLTLASVSTQFISCTRTFLPASLLTLTTSATLARRYKPSGIIPTSDATIDTTLFLIECPRKKWLCTYIIIPRGTMTIPIILTRLSSDFIIVVCCFFFPAFASSASFAAYEECPTLVSIALHSPDTTKLPERSISPLFFITSSDSPVMSDSFTLTHPSARIASALSWLPASNIHTSPFTSSVESILLI